MYCLKNTFSIIAFIAIFLFLLSGNTFSQTAEWECGFSVDPANLEMINPVEISENFKVGLLLVQFADWETNPHARGGLGWKYSDNPDSLVINKYNYDSYWNTFFSFQSYYDLDPPNPPIVHPDAQSHNTRVYGSFKDYWWEVSHGNVEIIAAQTHTYANYPLSHAFNTGIINHADTASGLVQWITLDENKSFYENKEGKLISDALGKANQMYDNGSLDVDVYDTEIFDKILIHYAGKGIGYSTIGGSRYTLSCEKTSDTQTYTCRMYGFGIHAHEFGHLLGFPDLYGAAHNEGVGYFCLMSLVKFENSGYLPAHVNPWLKLQSGWLAHEIINTDTSNFMLYPVADSALSNTPKVYILRGKGVPGPDNWDSAELDYFILENRSAIGFDRLYSFNRPDFHGGMVIWHYGPNTFSNSENIQVVEADGDFAISNSNHVGDPGDFFPGDDNVHLISDETWPNIKLQNEEESHYELKDISYDTQTNRVIIDSIKTNIGINTISGHTIWSGTKYINQDVKVLENAHLEILPGTVIIVNTPVIGKISIEFVENSTFTANGSENNKIKFISANSQTDMDWYGIIINKNVYLDIKNIEISNAATGITLIDSDPIQLENITIKNCVTSIDFINCENVSINGTNIINSKINCNFVNLQMNECIIDNSDLFVYQSSSSAIIQNSQFINSSFMKINGGNLKVINNVFKNGSYIWTEDIENNNPEIRNNIFIGQNNESTAILIRGDKPKIINNTICNYKFGINTLHESFPLIKNNILYNNYSSIELKGSVIYNNFLDKNTENAPTDSGNISVNPEFVDFQNFNFHLKPTSLCIDAGDPTSDYIFEQNPNGGRINLGAYGNTIEAAQSFDQIVNEDIVQNTVWSGWIYIENDLIIEENATLSIQSGTQILVENNKLISCNGVIMCNGNVSDSVCFDVYRNNNKWQGIFVKRNNESSVFQWTRFDNAENAIYLNGSVVEIRNCLFSNNLNGLICDESFGIVQFCTFKNNIIQGAYFSYSNVDILNSIFEKNQGRGIYIQYGTGINLNENIIRNNSWKISDIEIRGGIVIYSASPQLNRNEIYNNNYNGIITLSNCDPIMNWGHNANNLIANNGLEDEGPDFAEIQCLDFKPTQLDFGHNDIIDITGNWLIYSHANGGEWGLRGNYWGTTDEEEIYERIFGDFIIEPFDETSNTEGGIAQSEEKMLFNRGIHLEKSKNYTEALIRYDSLIVYHPSSSEAYNALDRIYSIYQKTELDFSQLRIFYLIKSNTNPSEKIRNRSKILATACLVQEDYFINAIDEYTLHAQSAINKSDSIYAEIDKSFAILKMNNDVLAKTTVVNNLSFSNKSELDNNKQYRNNVDRLLQIRRINEKSEYRIIPDKFTLYQNYPNPFNSYTSIRIDLPIDSKIDLEIFDVLGQKIKTITHKKYAAGNYIFIFNEKNMASGIYFYRLKAHKFVSTKRMLLLK